MVNANDGRIIPGAAFNISDMCIPGIKAKPQLGCKAGIGCELLVFNRQQKMVSIPV
jgi:hypothetical protein